jgi:hypothetical protein
MLTLFTTPVVYLYLDRLSVRWARKHPAHAGAPHDLPVPGAAGG